VSKWDNEHIVSKDARRGVVEQRPAQGKDRKYKKPRPFVVERRFTGPFWGKMLGAWRTVGKYSDREDAERMLAKRRQAELRYPKSRMEYRLVKKGV